MPRRPTAATYNRERLALWAAHEHHTRAASLLTSPPATSERQRRTNAAAPPVSRQARLAASRADRAERLGRHVASLAAACIRDPAHAAVAQIALTEEVVRAFAPSPHTTDDLLVMARHFIHVPQIGTVDDCSMEQWRAGVQTVAAFGSHAFGQVLNSITLTRDVLTIALMLAYGAVAAGQICTSAHATVAHRTQTAAVTAWVDTLAPTAAANPRPFYAVAALIHCAGEYQHVRFAGTEATPHNTFALEHRLAFALADVVQAFKDVGPPGCLPMMCGDWNVTQALHDLPPFTENIEELRHTATADEAAARCNSIAREYDTRCRQ